MKYLIFLAKELDINGNMRDILDKNFEFTNRHRKTIENEHYSQFEDYRDFTQDENTKYVNDKLSKLPISDKLKNLALDDVLMAFDATSLYPSAMWYEKSLYPKQKIGFALRLHMNDIYIEAFDNRSFNRDGIESAI